jgi:hypothetical protein
MTDSTEQRNGEFFMHLSKIYAILPGSGKIPTAFFPCSFLPQAHQSFIFIHDSLE